MKKFTTRLLLVDANKRNQRIHPIVFLQDSGQQTNTDIIPDWFSPPENRVRALMAYAQALRIIPTESAGIAECNIN